MEQVWHVIPHFEALKKVFMIKVTFFFLCTTEVDWPPIREECEGKKLTTLQIVEHTWNIFVIYPHRAQDFACLFCPQHYYSKGSIRLCATFNPPLHFGNAPKDWCWKPRKAMSLHSIRKLDWPKHLLHCYAYFKSSSVHRLPFHQS